MNSLHKKNSPLKVDSIHMCALLFICEGQGVPLEYKKKKEVHDNRLEQCSAQE